MAVFCAFVQKTQIEKRKRREVMKKTTKKMLSLFLAAAMLITSLGIQKVETKAASTNLVSGKTVTASSVEAAMPETTRVSEESVLEDDLFFWIGTIFTVAFFLFALIDALYRRKDPI